MMVYIFGIGGVGKSTIAKKVAEIHSKTHSHYVIKRICGVDPFNPKKENQKNVFIIDRYLTSLRNKFRAWKSLKKHHKHLAAIMLIVASTELIYQRRLHDKKRPDRQILDRKFLNRWKKLEREAAYKLARALQIPIIIIENKKTPTPRFMQCITLFLLSTIRGPRADNLSALGFIVLSFLIALKTNFFFQ